MTTFRELVAERGNLLSLYDLLEFMKQFDLSKIVRFLEYFSYLQGIADFADGIENNDYPVRQLENYPTEELTDFIGFVEAVGSRATLESIMRALQTGLYMQQTMIPKGIEDGAVIRTVKILVDGMGAAARNFSADIGGLKFFCLDSNTAILWEYPTKGWEDIISVFDNPTNKQKLANSTLEEQVNQASRCLAFGRGTACIMHLNNVLELGLIWMRRKLPSRYLPGQKHEIDDWVSAINIYVQQTPPPSDATQWRSISGCCAAIRVAWRHPAVHSDMIFSEESAREAYIAIRSLMKEIIKL